MRRSESSIEDSCRRYALKRGVPSVKLHNYITGDPDRLFMLPDHHFWLVEFKRLNGKLRPRQRVRQEELAAAGIHTTTIDDRDHFVMLLDLLLEVLVD